MSASGAGEDHGATNSDGVERISVPVREFIERDELHRTVMRSEQVL